MTLHEPLHRGQVQAEIANRRDDRRSASHARGGIGEHVAVEAVGVNDLNAAPPEVTREPCLLRHRGHAAERPDPVFRQRNLRGPRAPSRTGPSAGDRRIRGRTGSDRALARASSPGSRSRRSSSVGTTFISLHPLDARPRPHRWPQRSRRRLECHDLCDAHDACASRPPPCAALSVTYARLSATARPPIERSRTGRRSGGKRPQPRTPTRPTCTPAARCVDRATPAGGPRTARPPVRSAGRRDTAIRTTPAREAEVDCVLQKRVVHRASNPVPRDSFIARMSWPMPAPMIGMRARRCPGRSGNPAIVLRPIPSGRLEMSVIVLRRSA